MKKWQLSFGTVLVSAALMLGACSSEGDKSGDATKLTEGTVIGDGSSTVAPITEALVESYASEQPNIKVSVGVSGTGGGFEKLINNEIDFANASRPMKEEEQTKLEEAKIAYTEFKIANDGLTVVVNSENTWATNLTTEQLTQIWTEDGKTKKWSDINQAWPNEEITFFSPGVDSGTYDYFAETILEKADLVKSAQLSEDDNILVQGVANDPYAIGYFGFSYYYENKDKLKAVTINGIAPNHDTIETNEYTPLSRPLFVYVKNSALKDNEAVYNFMQYTLKHAGEMAELTGYVKLPDEQYEQALSQLEQLK